ncbi:MAG: RNA-binding transcriptional accessory protein [Defluviitaleaceae bacterium]|nr:RNA-binding transcriptional accessory protein [Defluviitaleaceae bacterium]
MSILKILEKEFNVNQQHLTATIELVDEGNTIPFIARYRKEVTGSMDDQVLRDLVDRLNYLRNLDATREQYRATIEAQGAMTGEIAAALNAAATLAVLEDIYRPFRPKRRTRASIAKERGLEPLALAIFAQNINEPIENLARPYIGEDVPDIAAAMAGASDIIAEIISDDADHRARIRHIFNDIGQLTCIAADSAAESVYEMYYDFAEPAKKAAGHRVLAINRGEKEGFLKADIKAEEGILIQTLANAIIIDNKFTNSFMNTAIEDSYKRLIAPSIEREIRNNLTEMSEEGAIKVFAANLRQLLLAAPIKDKVVLALDPGYRTGCKVAIIDGIGNVLHTDVIYPTPPANKIAEAKRALIPQITRHGVDIIAIGNGTASRETEAFAADLIRELADLPRKIMYVIVNEAGASVYSASKLGAAEFPDFDVALRSAVSIGRRLQDPLAELVKINPKSIGVGQYQHDMNQKRLGEALSGVVEACVNSVGVDLNTASPQLLSYIAGISAAVSKNIQQYRETNGKFTNRRQLLKVKGLGPKAYEQCAGFMRINDGDNPLDATGVHPESYDSAIRLLEHVGHTAADVRAGGLRTIKIKAGNLANLAKALNLGIPTLEDIINELAAPGRDPRDDAPAPVLRQDVLDMADLREGMVLQGTVRNIIDFGAFVDIGVHQDGLVHISQMADRYIKHPLEAVKLGDIVSVRVLSVDIPKKRISLSMKNN